MIFNKYPVWYERDQVNTDVNRPIWENQGQYEEKNQGIYEKTEPIADSSIWLAEKEGPYEM